jgi:hypothetical protein
MHGQSAISGAAPQIPLSPAVRAPEREPEPSSTLPLNPAPRASAIIHPSSPYLGANPETSDQSNLWLQPQWRSQ